ncbi:MAG: RNA polymerase factor sigma-54 [Acidobacteria bacterium]|nr:RNA polymerase factor sigma-54 [Acidobacteriota bacterium]
MGLEQKIQLKLSQKLVMTQALQQAIKLLQMTKLELQEVVAQELTENPLLEESTDEEGKPEEIEAEAEAQSAAEAQTERDAAKPPESTAVDDDASPVEKERDSFDEIDYDAYFQDYIEYGYNPRSGEEYDAFPLENLLTRPPDLSDHLTWQLQMSDASPEMKEVAAFLIGNVDGDGYLQVTDDEIAAAFPGVSEAVIEQTLQLVQSFDPIGICARNLKECLLLQVDRLELDPLLVAKVEEIVERHWDLFASRSFPQLAKALGVDMKLLETMVEVIRGLDPRPGRLYDNERVVYVEPDVHVRKVSDEYVIEVNDDGMPRLRLSQRYRQLLGREDSKGETANYIRDKMKSAFWLIKSLDQRQRTIYKVAESIVKHQRDFLDHGVDHLRPLVLRDVADDIQMHESTVSRVVSNKYIHTPRGLFPMKFFFHSGLDSRHGDDVSSVAVKARIKTMIDGEDARKPLSDSKIVKLLGQQGVEIARRTVAKYRDELRIPSSTDRKKIF